MEQPIYGKIVFGRNLTSEQWSKLQYRPVDDTDMYGIAENPSFGIDSLNYGVYFEGLDADGNVSAIGTYQILRKNVQLEFEGVIMSFTKAQVLLCTNLEFANSIYYYPSDADLSGETPVALYMYIEGVLVQVSQMYAYQNKPERYYSEAYKLEGEKWNMKSASYSKKNEDLSGKTYSYTDDGSTFKDDTFNAFEVLYSTNKDVIGKTIYLFSEASIDEGKLIPMYFENEEKLYNFDLMPEQEDEHKLKAYSEVPRFNIKATAVPSNGGEVTPVSGRYLALTNITPKAAANTNYTVEKIEVNRVFFEDVDFRLLKDTDITAYFTYVDPSLHNTILYNSTSQAEPDSSLNPTNETYDENSGNGSFDIDNNIVEI